MAEVEKSEKTENAKLVEDKPKRVRPKRIRASRKRSHSPASPSASRAPRASDCESWYTDSTALQRATDEETFRLQFDFREAAIVKNGVPSIQINLNTEFSSIKDVLLSKLVYNIKYILGERIVYGIKDLHMIKNRAVNVGKQIELKHAYLSLEDMRRNRHHSPEELNTLFQEKKLQPENKTKSFFIVVMESEEKSEQNILKYYNVTVSDA